MVKQIKYFSINDYYLVFIILLSSLFVYENVFSRNKWDRTFIKITYDLTDNSIIIGFLVFDYLFPVNDLCQEHAYLQWCDFYFTTNGKKYIRLMRAETSDQEKNASTIMTMSFKCKGEDIHFLGCRRPADGTKWMDTKNEEIVEVINDRNRKEKTAYAQFTVKWFFSEKYKKVKRIRVNGHWHVRGVGIDEIKDVDYNIPSINMLKSSVNQLEDNRVKVSANADAIVITGAVNGDDIKVYNFSGLKFQSTLATGDVINIKLPKKQIYTVIVGQTPYKIAL